MKTKASFGAGTFVRRKTLALAALAALASTAQAQDLSYLRGLLDATPQGGWVQVNTNKFSDAWITGAGDLPDGSYSDTSRVATAWSSVAWDSARGNLLLWGGGHANYMGNEMYIWQGDTGTWTRGSLPTRVERYNNTSNFLSVDNITPQSAHTYDNNLYVPNNDMFVTFGGAAFNSGGGFVNLAANGTLQNAGPWMWDPRRADANKVGGADGSGYDTSVLGGNMWTNQRDRWTGSGGVNNYVEANTAYRQENGRDVIYIAAAPGGSGRQNLYRYELADVRAGELGRFDLVGTGDSVVSFQSAATIDSGRGLYIRTASHQDQFDNFSGLGVWNLSKNDAANPGANEVQYVTLKFADGSDFFVSKLHGITYDSVNGKIFLWDGKERGTVYTTEAVLNADGSIAGNWTVTALTSTTAAQPLGQYRVDANLETGVLGKLKFVAELGAFVVLDQYQSGTLDAGVWFYKPFAVAVPEPETYALFLGGLGVIGWVVSRRRRLG